MGIGAVALWRLHDEWWSRIALGATLAITVLWSHHLLERSPSWHPWLRGVILIGGLLIAAGIVVPRSRWSERLPHAGTALAVGGLVIALAGPAAYSLDSASTPHTGAIPSAGPTVAVAGFGGPGRLPGAGRTFGGLPGAGGGPPSFGGLPGGSLGGPPGAVAGQAPGGTTSRGGPTGGPGGFAGGPGGGAGGLLNAGTVSAAMTNALQANASSYTWVAATVGAETASGYQLAAGEPVMAIGGFNGTDNTPSLAAFKSDVAAGKIHYFIGGGMGGPGGQSRGSSDSSEISQWVAAHFTAKTIGGTTVYDLTVPASSSATSTTATTATSI